MCIRDRVYKPPPGTLLAYKNNLNYFQKKLDTLGALWHYIHITKEKDMIYIILFITFILMFMASPVLFVGSALMLGVDVGTILALVCMIGTFAGMTALEKIVTGKA